MKLSCRFSIALLAIVILAGCGEPKPPQGTLSGDITINGKIYDGSIELIVLSSQTGKAAVTPIQKDGTYSFEKPLVAGEYTAYLAPSSPPEAATQAVAVVIDKNISEEYWNESSPLKVTIVEGENKIKLTIPKE